jgi:hypothetical protein
MPRLGIFYATGVKRCYLISLFKWDGTMIAWCKKANEPVTCLDEQNIYAVYL